jgi:tetratricopeptide (TPR) repeat protein
LGHLAWALATCPDVKLRDSQRAVELAQEAVEASPMDASSLGTLGTALYHAGEYQAAVTKLEKAIELRGTENPNSTAMNAFFLAMAHGQLGNIVKAHQWYDRAGRIMEKNQPKDPQLRRFRAEAEAVLAIKGRLEERKEE